MEYPYSPWDKPFRTFVYSCLGFGVGDLTFLPWGLDYDMDLSNAKHALKTEFDERRANERMATVYRPVLIEAQKFAGFCLLRNLSDTGIMGHVYVDFAQDLPVTIHFGQATKVAGTLVWCKDGRVGVRFDQTINVDDMLAQLAAKEVNGRLARPPRLQLKCKGRLIIGDRSLAIEVLDVSQRGIKVLASFIMPGDELYVEVRGLERRKAVVRWTRDSFAGLHFVRPLSFEQLAIWAVTEQADKLPDLRAAANS